MLLVDANRDIFQFLAANRRYAEIGVYRGDYARGVKAQKPSIMYLIDPWRPGDLSALVPADFIGDPHASLLQAYANYYPGGLVPALQRAYDEVALEFGSDPQCRIMRMISSEACSEFPPGSLDILYIDGNHRYDFVLADLERWNSKLAEGGCIILNDCYVSHIGKRQHISVLEAVSTFIKLSDWRPAALVNRQFTDVVLTRESHVKKAKFDIKMRLIAQGTGFIELPASLIHSLSHRLMRIETDEKTLFREYMSFGD